MIRLILGFVLVTDSLNKAHSQKVTPANNSTLLTVQKGANADFQWNYNVKSSEVLLNYQLFDNKTTLLWDDRSRTVTEAGKRIFGNRLSVDKSSNFLKVVLEIITWNDTGVSLKLTGGVFDQGTLDLVESISSIITLEVQGGPEFCGEGLLSVYHESYSSIPRYNACILSNPAPKTSIQFNGWYLAVSTRKISNNMYNILITLPRLTASDCGKNLKYNISIPDSPETKPLVGMSKVVLIDLPLDLTMLNHSLHKNGTLQISWKAVKSGKEKWLGVGISIGWICGMLTFLLIFCIFYCFKNKRKTKEVGVKNESSKTDSSKPTFNYEEIQNQNITTSTVQGNISKTVEMPGVIYQKIDNKNETCEINTANQEDHYQTPTSKNINYQVPTASSINNYQELKSEEIGQTNYTALQGDTIYEVA
uniref:Uncharacterized protein n=1 Tax=Clytia hemisphaerica TaxID=252671 RepID=A0A7M5VDZ1_9CNID